MSAGQDAAIFSKVRLEALSDGVFAIAMTLLVLELKVPEVAKGSPSAQILEGLAHEALGFAGYALTFAIAGQFWIFQHVFLHYLRHASRGLTLLTLLFLMFVSLLPFSTSMLTHFGLREPVGLIWYFGNYWILSVVMTAQWFVARRGGLLPEDGRSRVRRQFELMTCAQPVALLVPMATVFVAPASAMTSLWIVTLVVAFGGRRLAARSG